MKKDLKQSNWKNKLIALQPDDNTLWNTAKRMRKKHVKISALHGPAGIAYSNTDKAETIANSLKEQFTLNDLHDTETEIKVNSSITDFNNLTDIPQPFRHY
ncbi:hypothetical protein AVEN_210571-1 [Araneus ventricosus]|uniref:Uncharacterized protein n=1 Tax=Araneus ventricosus TaxID=182803 RepID=A0A4Y2Q131_ARAVE|nr:hypothetical protein AVEN_210571-1 [Araneus ventricosus]